MAVETSTSLLYMDTADRQAGSLSGI